MAFGPENLGLPREELRRRVEECLALAGLDGLDDRDPATLSGGQRQLLALAAVPALEPKLLVLDEPTTDLDPVRVEELLATLDRLTEPETSPWSSWEKTRARPVSAPGSCSWPGVRS